MRILSVIHDLEAGGTQRAAINHTEGFARAGHDAAILAYDAAGPRERDLDAFDAHRFIQRDDDQPDAALHAAAAWKPDAVHVHRTGHTNPRTAHVLRTLRDAGARAVIETNHFARADPSPDRTLIDLHLQLSRWCLWQWTHRSARLSPKPIGVVLPHIIRHDRFAPVTDEQRLAWRAQHGIPADAAVFGRTARPSMAKWTPLLINAFDAVARTHPNAWLLTVGLPDKLLPLRDALPEDARRRVVTLPVTNNDTELATAYAAMDVLAHHAKRGETFGMVLCEAALCGVPAITMSQPLRDNSQVEVVAHEQRGLVAGNARGFETAMRRLADDPALRATLANNAREWTLTHCDIDTVTTRLLALFNAVIESEGNRDALRRALDSEPTSVALGELMHDLKSVPGAAPWGPDRLKLMLSGSRTLTEFRQRRQRAAGKPG